MIEAEKKRRSNVIEYLLYMFHQEDVIRGCQMNLECLEKRYLTPLKIDGDARKEQLAWYKQVVELMERENIEIQGHLEEVLEIIGELSYVHTLLLDKLKDDDYRQRWEAAYPNIVELKERTEGASSNPIELCLNGIYGVMVLRMQKKEVIPETVRAIKTFTDLLNLLGKRYHEIQARNSRES